MKTKLIIFPWKLFILLQLLLFLGGFIYGCFSVNDQIIHLHPKELDTSTVFHNNILVLFSILVIGTLTGGVYSLFVVVFNGVIVGETLYTIFKGAGISPIFTGFLPHALPELLSIFLMSSITCLPIYILIKIKTVSFFWKKVYLEIGSVILIASVCCGFASLIEGYYSSF
ncbi:stage II sporulation protein M [Bacillus cereus]|uniref:stage II sporulation protein M n=1 Tax=Bacillus cereus TaxID=1396 RepID=UPI0024054C38|nr:stage II sporulation protein M [Bacillus cereus]MDF9623465.1 stage II sporulation protein M [Bacillus cereus]HDR7494840.1 stage II sporulation protein M [Bacillus cereus]